LLPGDGVLHDTQASAALVGQSILPSGKFSVSTSSSAESLKVSAAAQDSEQGQTMDTVEEAARNDLVDDFHGRRAANSPSARPHCCLAELRGLDRDAHALVFLKMLCGTNVAAADSVDCSCPSLGKPASRQLKSNPV
jgi:hypothetical protein